MTRVSRLFARTAALLVAATALAVSGCHHEVLSDAQTAKLEKGFDTTIQSYKSGQFELGGAVLSAADLGGHFAYLRDQGKLPKRVLLLPSDDSKIRKIHLQFMARMSLDYGFTVFYDHKGELRRIEAEEKNARALEDHRARAPLGDPLKGKEASDGGFSPEQQY